MGITAAGLFSTLTRLTAIINGINKIKSVQCVNGDGNHHAAYCYNTSRFVLLFLMGLMVLLKQSSVCPNGQVLLPAYHIPPVN